MQTRSKLGITKPKRLFSFSNLCSKTELASFKEPSLTPQWQKVMADEFHVLIANDTWDVVPYYPAQNLAASKWVYRIKYKLDGNIEQYKVRMVTASNHQQAGIDFHETIYLVIRSATICLILSISGPKSGSLVNLMVRMPFFMKS